MVGQNAIFEVENTSFTVDIYPFFYTSKGTYLVYSNIYSQELNNYRDIVIYTPPSYNENPYKSYPLLIMNDGQNMFNDSTAFQGLSWNCSNTLDYLVITGGMKEIIAVGVYNTKDRLDEYTYSYDSEVGGGGNGDKYLDFVVSTVIPTSKKFVDNRIKEGRENVAIMGSSLGGLISCYALWTRSEHFGQAACMSSSFWWNDEDFNAKILNLPQPKYPITIYVDSGNAGNSNDGVVQTKQVFQHLNKLGYIEDVNLYYYVDQGASHSEYYWGKRFYIPMVYLYQS
eukprot:TRINITY_DN1238_c0_g1_i1.p1 TRINITY_DN1238_c0_g1~~TRINITY_DN1238_c0_g1_i1.p1  ORF type:complete len:284 (-),score=33.79 TRINITY_DN1238_c0_g1_i1:60-911(-)